MSCWRDWRHITKLDPARPISDSDLEQVINSGTQAIMISGSQGVTPQNTLELLSRLEGASIPVVIEASIPMDFPFDRIPYLFVPCVLNSRFNQFIAGIHADWIAELGNGIRWDKLLAEAYLVLNRDSAVGRMVGAIPLSRKQLLGYAMAADRYFKFPIVYLEYSGSYGDPELVAQVKSKLTQARLFYGGGIDSGWKALQMARAADTIVVGNVVYRDLKSYLETIV